MKNDLTQLLRHAREIRDRRARLDPRKVDSHEMSASLATHRQQAAQDLVDLLERLLAAQNLAKQTLLDAGLPDAAAPLAWIGPNRQPLTAAVLYAIADIDQPANT